MKKIFRMIVFPLSAICITSLWNKGFIIKLDFTSLLTAVIVISIIWYILLPISKIVLFPIQLLTMGLVSTIVYFLMFYFFVSKFSFIDIKSWVFPGVSLLGIVIAKTQISFIANVFISSLSISTIINLEESVL